MIYFVSNNKALFISEHYTSITPEESIAILNTWHRIQYDSETTGKDAHVNHILLIQFGNKEAGHQIVVDVTSVNILLYKEILESKYLIGQNLKFDLQFLFNEGIVPLNVYDTMIIEQLLYLGYPFFLLGADDDIIMQYFDFTRRHVGDKIFEKDAKYRHTLLVSEEPEVATFISEHSGASLKALEYRYLDKVMDKTVRGQIIRRGIDDSVIVYAANDVVDLEDIMERQLLACKNKDIHDLGLSVENKFVPVIAYLEWCGIKLDVEQWKIKMEEDQENVNLYLKKLNDFISSNLDKYPALTRFTHDDGFFADQFDTIVAINWDSPIQAVEVAKVLGFNTRSINKLTGEEGDSVLEKVLKFQKGINDEFLDIYFKYKECKTLVSSFGQKYLHAINPNTGRIHTVFRQLGTSSGRMACGSDQVNVDLAKYKGLPVASGSKSNDTCKYPQLQNLPADKRTRDCFISEPDNSFCSCDYSSLEARLGADIYEEQAMIEEYLHGSGDMHSLMAITFFGDIIGDIPTKEVKEKFPELRKKAKSPEFLIQFGGSDVGLSKQLGCELSIASGYVNKYYAKFKNIANFKARGVNFVKHNGYVLMCKYTGHKMFWYDFKPWFEESRSYTSEFWDDYRVNHKGTSDNIASSVSKHFKAGSKWERMALNAPTQGEQHCPD